MNSESSNFLRMFWRTFLILTLCLSFSYDSNGFDFDIFGLGRFKPEIYLGKEKFLKEPFYNDDHMTDITHIVTGELDPELGADIGIFGQLSLHIVDFNGRDKSKVSFGWKVRGILEPALRLKGRGIFEIIACGIGPLGVMDQTGKPVWIYEDKRAYSMATGDLNQDAIPEYYVGSSALVQLNDKGQKIWEKSKKSLFYNVQVYEPSETGKPLVVTRDFEGRIQFRDYNGNVVREWIPEKKFLFFRLCRWLDSDLILTASDDEIFLIDISGKTFFRHKLSHCPGNILDIRGTPVTFSDNKTYLAVIAYTNSVDEGPYSTLCIFSPEKELVYQELLNVTTGLLAVKFPSTDGEVLLVGDGPGKVNKYSMVQ